MENKKPESQKKISKEMTTQTALVQDTPKKGFVSCNCSENVVLSNESNFEIDTQNDLLEDKLSLNDKINNKKDQKSKSNSITDQGLHTKETTSNKRKVKIPQKGWDKQHRLKKSKTKKQQINKEIRQQENRHKN